MKSRSGPIGLKSHSGPIGIKSHSGPIGIKSAIATSEEVKMYYDYVYDYFRFQYESS